MPRATFEFTTGGKVGSSGRYIVCKPPSMSQEYSNQTTARGWPIARHAFRPAHHLLSPIISNSCPSVAKCLDAFPGNRILKRTLHSSPDTSASSSEKGGELL